MDQSFRANEILLVPSHLFIYCETIATIFFVSHLGPVSSIKFRGWRVFLKENYTRTY